MRVHLGFVISAVSRHNMSNDFAPASGKGRAMNRSLALDLLRGVAVLAVIVLHTSHHAIGRGVPLFDDWLWPVIRHFYLGVQLFFVISGYCIMGAVQSAERDARPIMTYIRRRIRRIYPPYWFSLILLIVLGGMTVFIARKTWWDVFPLTGTDWLLNVVLLQQLFGAPDASLPYWSLSIEVQFYVLMAVCLLVPKRRSQWLVAVSGLNILGMWSVPHLIAGTALAHWAEFACGIAAYSFRHPQGFQRGLHWQLWGVTALAIFVGGCSNSRIYIDNGEFILPIKQAFCMLFGAVMLLMQRAETTARPAMMSRGLAWIGSISYSLYLTHMPVASRVFNLTGRFMALNGLRWCIVALVATFLQFAVGWLFYRFCEARWLNSASNRHSVPVVPAIRSSAIASGNSVRSSDTLIRL